MQETNHLQPLTRTSHSQALCHAPKKPSLAWLSTDALTHSFSSNLKENWRPVWQPQVAQPAEIGHHQRWVDMDMDQPNT